MRKVDTWLACLFFIAALTEIALVPELAARPLSAALGLVFSVLVAWRRTYPLATTATAFGLAASVTGIEILLGHPDLPQYAGMCILLLPYTLFRWGTRSDAAIGLTFMVLAFASSVVRGDMGGVGEAIGGAVVMLFPAAVGLVMRFRADARSKELAHAKLKEREQLARELHDSVAHHMMAIAIQAQAAVAVLDKSPDAAKRALQAIEAESKNTLSELRAIVGALRDDSDAALLPGGRLGDIAALAPPASPALALELVGALDTLPPALERALYRLAQESITNAVKHAKRATRVNIRIAAESGSVRFTVEDDGTAQTAKGNGFGLVGMAERAALLGGTFAAGPGPTGGWRVEAVLPCTTGAT